MEPLNSRRMTFDDASWQEEVQRIDYEQVPWSIRDIIDYYKPLTSISA
jgi:hypothetical protein